MSFTCLRSCLGHIKSAKSRLPIKSFLLVEEDDFPSVFGHSVLSGSNRKLAKTEFSRDEDYDSDRETVKKHQRDALKSLNEQINKFKSSKPGN